MDVGVQLSRQDLNFKALSVSERGLLDHMIILVLIFWGTAILFSITATLFFILTNSAKGIWFLHILINVQSKKEHTLIRSWVSSCAVCNPVDCGLLGSSVHGILQARILEWAAFPSPGGLPDPGIEPTSFLCLPHWQVDSLPLTHLGSPFL